MHVCVCVCRGRVYGLQEGGRETYRERERGVIAKESERDRESQGEQLRNKRERERERERERGRERGEEGKKEGRR